VLVGSDCPQWHHTGIEGNVVEFVLVQYSFILGAWNPSDCKKCVQILYAYLLRICNIWFISCLYILLHISDDLLYNYCQDGLKIQQKKSQGCEFSLILAAVLLFSHKLVHICLIRGKLVVPL
jgi:hypothetical protein